MNKNSGIKRRVVGLDEASLGDLDVKHGEEKDTPIYTDKVMVERHDMKLKAMKRMKKLLDVSEKYSSAYKKVAGVSFKTKIQEKVDNMMKTDNFAHKDALVNELKYFQGTLRPYQIEGVAWLKTLFEHGVNGILADEMGLGKTVEIIALLSHMLEKRVAGPFLIVVPLSTLPNWRSEFAKFAPKIPVVIFHGDASKRLQLWQQTRCSFVVDNRKVKPVVITTVQMMKSEFESFNSVVWKYIIVDEGHILKNHESETSRCLRTLQGLNKILLTGTPLQNNLTELWSLLNFLMPHLFKNVNTFSSLLMLEEFQDNTLVKEEQCSVISTIHKVLKPFMLRRLKSDVLKDLAPKKEVLVHCPLSKLQRTLYTYILNKNIPGLFGGDEEKELDVFGPRLKRKCTANKNYADVNNPDDVEAILAEAAQEAQLVGEEVVEGELVKFLYTINMANPLMMFKKVVDHPYLVHTPVTPDKKSIVIDENLVNESGKMLVLDAILQKLKIRKHKVLIFSTLVMMLDLIEEYMLMRRHTYRRLDGSVGMDARGAYVNEFNDDPEVFAFLISTRSGGLGLNLIGADTVIFYDRDWNPQVDIQAQDRCHRIGQTKPVMVYTLVTKNTIDEQVIKMGTMKRKLEKVVIKNGKFKNSVGKDKDLDLLELKKMLENTEQSEICANGLIFSDEELEQLLDRSEMLEEMERFVDGERG